MDDRGSETGAEWALVTGPSRGIGLEVARQLAAGGTSLVLVARSGDRLRELARELEEAHGIRARVGVADLTDATAPDRLHRSLEAEGIRPRVLVNNAGFGDFGLFHEAPTERLIDVVRLNAVAVTHLTRLFLPGMVEAGRGRVLNVASTAAFQPGPLMAVYYATKAYVLSLSEALAEEVRGTGVTVTCLCPGPTRTGFQSEADMEDSGLLRLGLMDAGDVARLGLRAMRRGRRIVVPGVMNRLGTIVVRLLPRSVVTWAVKHIQKPVS